MLADEDNPLEAPDRDRPAVAEPQLVVVYRSRGVPWYLIPPLIVLAGVGGVVAYRRSAPDEPPRPVVITNVVEAPALPVEPTPVVPTPVASSAPAKPEPLPEPTPSPAIASPVSPPTPAPVSTTTPLPAPAPPPAATPEPSPPTEPIRRDAVGFDPEAARVEGPLSAASPATDPMLAGVFRGPGAADAGPPAEANPPAPLQNFEDQNLPRTRMDLIIDATKRAGADRRRFHDDLKSLLTEMGTQAGPEIRMLCDRYGRDTRPEILQMMNRDLVGAASRLSTPARVQRMRRWGVPETIILDDLAEQQENNLKARGGPRTKNEVWVRAARVLLAMPPTPPTTAATPRPR